MTKVAKIYTAEQRIERAVVRIMAEEKYVALAGVMMMGSRTVTDEKTGPGGHPMTACTDGVNETYGRDFVESLTDAQLRFLILHEVYHKLYRHLTTWKWMYDAQPELANAACDFVINAKLVEDNKGDNFATMTGPLTIGCYDEKYLDWDAAQVYQDLFKNAKKVGVKYTLSDGKGFDIHDWESAAKLSKERRDQLERELDAAIRQGALLAGKTGSGGDRTFGDLLETQVNWRDVLRDFVTSVCSGHDFSTWARPNRRFIGGGHYLPSGISQRVGQLVVAVDTSGSTFAPGVLETFLSEVKAICDTVKPDGVHLLYWDTAVCQAEYYPAEQLDGLVQTTKPAGGGGTTVECVPAYMAEHSIKPEAVVVLTDGYLGGGWGEWGSTPVLWCIIDNKSATPNNGVVVHIKNSDL